MDDNTLLIIFGTVVVAGVVVFAIVKKVRLGGELTGVGGPTPVGVYPAGNGPFGHCDLAGNVWEWCLDAWDSSGVQQQYGQDVVDPEVKGGADGHRVRGGSWYLVAEFLRSAYRFRNPATYRYINLGFRVAVAPASR